MQYSAFYNNDKIGRNHLENIKIICYPWKVYLLCFGLPVAMIWRPIYISVKIQILEGFFIIWSQKQYHRHP